MKRVGINILSLLVYFCLSTSVVQASSPYDGWWFDADHPGSGISVEIQGDTMFAAIYCYLSESPFWFTSAAKYQTKNDIWYGPLVMWMNGAAKMFPDHPTSYDAGAFGIRFYSEEKAGLVYKIDATMEDSAVIYPLSKFMPSISPGQPDNRVKGWWYVPGLEGMGIFMEAQGGTLFGAWYFYYADKDENKGIPEWYSFSGSFENGTTSFQAPLKVWYGGSQLGIPPYSSPSASSVGLDVHLKINANGTIDFGFAPPGEQPSSTLTLQKFNF